MVIEEFHGVWCLRLVWNVSRRAVSKRKPGYVAEERARAGAKPDSLISGNRLCGPHLTGIVRTWLVWEPSLVSHDIHGLRPPRGQHGDPIPCQLFDLRTANLNISEKEIHVYFILVCRRRNDIAGGVTGRHGTPLQKDHRRVNLWNSTLSRHQGSKKILENFLWARLPWTSIDMDFDEISIRSL